MQMFLNMNRKIIVSISQPKNIQFVLLW